MTRFPGCPPVPLKAAQAIAKFGGYDQVLVIARKCGGQGGEWVTAYGVDEAHLAAAQEAAEFLKYKVMRWPKKVVE